MKAFREARDQASITDAQYLPFYHAMHDEVAALAQRAKDLGSDTAERIFHLNAIKALNAAMGIASGQRGALDMSQRLILTTLQAIYRRHLHDALETGAGHREAGRRAKAAVLAYMDTAGALLLGVAACLERLRTWVGLQRNCTPTYFKSRWNVSNSTHCVETDTLWRFPHTRARYRENRNDSKFARLIPFETAAVLKSSEADWSQRDRSVSLAWQCPVM